MKQKSTKLYLREEQTMFASTEEAIQSLQDSSQTEHHREEAIRFLQHNPSDEGVAALVAALEDDDSGVRWASGTALAIAGEAALRPLVMALTSPSNSARLREGARHVFHQSSSQKVQRETAKLQKCLRGIDADLRTMEAAYELLNKFG
jgi:HEAT repeat protein